MAKKEWFVVLVTDNEVTVEKATRKPHYIGDDRWGEERSTEIDNDPLIGRGWGAGGFVAGALGIVDTKKG